MPTVVEALMSYTFSVERPRTTAILVQIADDNSASESVICKNAGFCVSAGGEELVERQEETDLVEVRGRYVLCYP